MKNIMRLLLCSVILCLSSCSEDTRQYYRCKKDNYVSDICLYQENETQYCAWRLQCYSKWDELYLVYYFDKLTAFTYDSENNCVYKYINEFQELAKHIPCKSYIYKLMSYTNEFLKMV